MEIGVSKSSKFVLSSLLNNFFSIKAYEISKGIVSSNHQDDVFL